MAQGRTKVADEQRERERQQGPQRREMAKGIAQEELGGETWGVTVFEPLMTRHQVTLREDYQAAGLRLRGPRALLDAILANLLINAIHALDRQSEGSRELLVRTSKDSEHLILEVADTGAGIRRLPSKVRA